LWKDFEQVGLLLATCSVGQHVRRLHTLLARVQELNGVKFSPVRQDTFGRRTEEAVTNFQRAKQIRPDGVVGPLTLVLLYNSLNDYQHPSLGIGSSPAVAEDAVKPEGPVQEKTMKATFLGEEST
jgi:hypothetical protein